MPIKVTGKMDLEKALIAVTKKRLSLFLDNEELAKTEIIIPGGKVNFNAEQKILDKITQNLGEPL